MELNIFSTSYDDVKADLHCEDGAGPSVFTGGSGNFDISGRDRTTASALWDDTSIGEGWKGSTISLTTPIQEIVTDYTITALVVIAKPYSDATRNLRGKTHEHMYAMSKGCGDPFAVLDVIGNPGQYWNPSMFDDPYYTETFEAAEQESDPVEAKKLLKHLNAYIIEQAPYVIQPVSYGYSYAWPWVKNWYGELSPTTRSPGYPLARIWIDEDLKKDMGY